MYSCTSTISKIPKNYTTMPDIFYELNKVQKKQRINTLIKRIAVLIFVLVQFPVFFMILIGNEANIAFAITMEFAITISVILIYFKKIRLGLFLSSLLFYLMFAMIPHVFVTFHLVIFPIMGTFIFNTYAFQDKRLRYFNFIAVIVVLISYAVALYAYHDMFLRFIVDVLVGMTSFTTICIVINYFKKDVEKYEQKLQEANNFLTQITDLNPHFIYAKDKGNRFTFVNKTIAVFHGCSPNEMIGRNVKEFYEKSEMITSDDTDTAKIGEEHYLVTLTDQNNQSTYVELTQTPMFDKNNKMIGTLGVGIDITASRRAKRALQISEQRYRKLYENHQMGIVSARKGKFSTVNDTFCTMTGYTRAEIIGQNIKGIMHPDDYEATLDKTEKVDTGKSKGDVFEHRFIRKDGTIGYALLHHQLLGIEGEPLEAMGTLTDISLILRN